MPAHARIAFLLPLALAAACKGSPGAPVGETTSAIVAPRPPRLQVVFRNGRVFAREGKREWSIAEVDRDQMLWAPDGLHFAYLRREEPASRPTASAEPPPGKVRSDAGPPPPTYRVVIRNIRGDSVNEFSVYRPGRPSQLDWIDDDTLGYLAPPDRSGDAYVIHAARTSEILSIRRGRHFAWSPGRRQLAYIAGKNELIKVDDQVIWPRSASERTSIPRQAKHRRRIQGHPIWSPDGSGIAFMAVQGGKATLVVLLVLDNPGGDLSWPLPRTALLPDNHLFWGESKVVIGESMLKPRFAASWKRIH